MTLNSPRVTFQILRAQELADSIDHRVLIVGQKDGGSATAGELVESVPSTEAQINALFGARSQVAQMVRAFRAINKLSQLDVISLDDNAGASNATSIIGLAGTATEAGRITFEAASGAQRSYDVDAVVGDTAAVLAARLDALTSGDATAPFTSSVTSGDVTLTAANGGTLANDWHLRVDGSIAGITTTLTAWTGGATDPVLTGVFDPVVTQRYQTIVWPSVYDDSTVESFLNDRFNNDGPVLQGVAIITDVDTAANVLVKAAALDSQSVVVFPSKAVAEATITGNALREMADVNSARIAALRSLRLTDDAALGNFLTTPAPFDQLGGRALASLPYANTIIPNQSVIRRVDSWTLAEQLAFENGGVAMVGPNAAFSGMVLGNVVTTSLTDGSGNDNTSFKFLNTVDTAAAIRDAFDVNCRSRYAQTRLTDGDLIAGRDMANQASIEAFTEEIHQSLADDTLIQAGEASLSDFKQNGRIVTLDLAAGRVSIDIAPLFVSGVRVIVGSVTVNFGD